MINNYAEYQIWWREVGHHALADYTEGKTSCVVGLSPQRALEYSAVEITSILHGRLGTKVFQQALNPKNSIESHLANRRDGNWLKSCNTVGINVRTIGSFWNVLKYALTLPDHIRGIHLLPIWEPGVVGSLYGMASWNLNWEFLDGEALRMFPQLRSLENQLKVTINLLHAMGKVVGMDVIPHTDRYGEMVLANPSYFEWLRRDDLTITDHRENLHEDVEIAILDWLKLTDPHKDFDPRHFFYERPEADRLVELFGAPGDYDLRVERRVNLVDYLYHQGLESVPATMAPPYRGLEVDPSDQALTIDDAGHRWRDYRITKPESMSRVFGPLTRYKFYGRRDDNRDWAIDFDRPRKQVWDYFTEKYAEQCAKFGFDFMRGDMSHVQMRPEGVPQEIGPYYDPLRAVKLRIAEDRPHFAYFAESFLAPPGVMAYGDEVEHLVASEADVTLGDLQSEVPGTERFQHLLTTYLEIAETTEVTPAFTIITGDKDDPRFDHFHHHGEIARLFTGFFLGKLPAYFSLGFELRDRHFEPAPNEKYTKLYVFQERTGPKATNGRWQWGSNFTLLREMHKLHRFAENILPKLNGAPDKVPAPTVGSDGLVCWTRADAAGVEAYLFVVNFAAQDRPVNISLDPAFSRANLLFALPEAQPAELTFSGDLSLGVIAPGGVRCYQLH
ncbi:hypothetical protein GGR28_000899 [Lewinella aquimaris]|uniref:Uncharacterized protein n=1 Tax=Neolewinella aquimaris TaxID=1835722 RepID=A0A840E8A4_9BACT|nr:hypothetical protein [Neolewinella aquimaris]MBB4078298.1 hypothetical protein [Neolewinella aquimaris]